MDLIKIGKYIAGKRKNLGLTQKQLAEKLGMSDKSVSKWERGVCLPDVSVYMELCNILQISINEFLAGEDISKENIVKKSESNLIQVAKDSKYRQKYLKRMIIALCVIILFTTGLLASIMIRKLLQPSNYIVDVDQESTEMKTAELLSGVNGAFMFNYSIRDTFKTLTIFVSEYQFGKLVEKNEVAYLAYDDIASATEGKIILIPDVEQDTVKLIVTDEYARCCMNFSILEEVEHKEDYGRGVPYIEGQMPIQFGSEQGLIAFIYSKNGVRASSIKEIENGEVGTNHDYVYYLSFQFDK